MSTYTHKHHIIPRHMGGTDDPENLIELTVEEHAEAHRKLYEEHGHWQDYYAWKGLAGQIKGSEIRSAIQSKANSVPKPYLSKLYKERCANGEMQTPRLFGKDNAKSRQVRVGNKVYETVTAASIAEGISRPAIKYRCDSKKFTDWCYL